MKINNKGYAITLIVFGILIVFIVVLSTLLITMNNSVKLNKTVKESVVESIQLGADTSGTSFIDRIEAIESKLSDINGNIIDTIYPVGSVYITATDATVGAVEDRFRNTKWQKYAQGRTLIGSGTDDDGNIFLTGQTGGSSSVSLSTSNLPSHSHSIPALSGNTSSSGEHTHIVQTQVGNTLVGIGTYINYDSDSTSWGFKDVYDGPYAEGSSGKFFAANAGIHTHNVTTTASNTGSIGSSKSFSVQNPYITVYMYKRIN